jgi:muramoyltetrapeptide carboxypeptidase
MKHSTRRTFIKNIAIGTSVAALAPLNVSWKNSTEIKSANIEKIFPKRLKKGDTIGLVSPGGFIDDDQLEESVKNIEKLGFKPYYRDIVTAREGYFGGTDKVRANDLMHMFTNKSVDAILCTRGGYGSNRILDLLDFEKIRQNPKALIGYSDVTSLLIAIYQKTGLIGFHGPVGISTFNEFSVKSFEKVLIKAKKQYKYANEREKDTEKNSDYDKYTITKGKAEGNLIGGNLVMLTTLIGTKYEPDFENKIVFMEEIREKPYKIDRMITHLLMATNIAKASGIILGIFNKCDIDKDEIEESYTLKEALYKRLSSLNLPCFYGMPFGHVSNKITLPVGVIAKMNADKQTLTLTEAAVMK